jgi:hypothetical protein
MDILPYDLVCIVVLLACNIGKCAGVLRTVCHEWKTIIDHSNLHRPRTSVEWVVSVSAAEYAIQQGCLINDSILSNLVHKGYLDVLKYISSRSKYRWQWKNYYLCANAAAAGQLEVLKWLRSIGCFWSLWTSQCASEKGHLEVLQWAQSNGCAWNEYGCDAAARGGHLNVLEWSISNGCPFRKETCINEATKNNHHHIIEYINNL